MMMRRMMTFLIGSTAFVGLFVSGGPAAGQVEETVFRRYPVESAIVEYTAEGAQRGGETLYFDGWGEREARHTRIYKERLGVQNLMTLEKGDWKYTVDLDKKAGVKEKNNFLLLIKKESRRLNTSTWADTLVQALGAQKAGQENVAGRICDVWQIDRISTTYCFWKGIPLKQEVMLGNGQKIVMTARKVTENPKIPADRFEIPKDITFIEGRLDDVIISRRIDPLGGCYMRISRLYYSRKAVSLWQRNFCC